VAERVECESGNVYELKLGAVLLHKMSKGMGSLIPPSVMKRIDENIKPEELKGMLTDEETDYIREREAVIDIEHLRICLKTVNGSTEGVEEFLEEEMPSKDLKKLVEIIDEHILEYTKGVEERGESNPSSSREEKENGIPLPA